MSFIIGNTSHLRQNFSFGPSTILVAPSPGSTNAAGVPSAPRSFTRGGPARARRRRGFLLVDVLMGMFVTSLLAVLLAGISLAASEGWDYTMGVESVNQQGRVLTERFSYMIGQAGVYQLTGQHVVPGLAIVERVSNGIRLPEILVVWSGGRSGGMAAAGLQSRLPLTSELVLYAPSPTNPNQFVELVNLNNPTSIDFKSAGFAATIQNLWSTSTDQVLLADCVHVSGPSATATYPTTAANVRFELYSQPDDATVAALTPGSAAWYAAPWTQGVVTSTTGLRQVTVRLELLLEPRGDLSPGGTLSTPALPIFGSGSLCYVYQ